jgi:hypothetical protein
MRTLIHPRNIVADPEVRVQIVKALETALGPVRSRLDAIDVYLTDVNGARGGPDKRCRVVAYLPPRQPVVVSRTDRDPVAAVIAAATRCRRSIRSRLKQRHDRRRRAATV